MYMVLGMSTFEHSLAREAAGDATPDDPPFHQWVELFHAREPQDAARWLDVHRPELSRRYDRLIIESAQTAARRRVKSARADDTAGGRNNRPGNGANPGERTMTKKSAADLIETLAAELAQKAGFDQNTARAMIMHAIKTQKDLLLKAAMPSGRTDGPRIGPGGEVVGGAAA